MQKIFTYLFSNRQVIVSAVIEHIKLVMLAMLISIVLGIIIGIVCTYVKALENILMPMTQVMMVIPSLALMGTLIPIIGIGYYNAIVCLIIYSLLPIVKNTFTGIKEIPKSIIEAANGMGMREIRCLFLIKLPLAIPVIMAGVRSSTVMLVGIATIMAQVGAGGLGRIVFRGVDQANMPAIIVGAFLVSALAVSIDKLLSFAQKCLEKIFCTKEGGA